jgi:hypothetical protein
MGHLVGKQNGKLGFVVQARKDTCVQINDAVGKGKGIKMRIFYEPYSEIVLCADLQRLELVCNLMQIVLQRWISIYDPTALEYSLLLRRTLPEPVFILRSDEVLLWQRRRGCGTAAHNKATHQ